MPFQSIPVLILCLTLNELCLFGNLFPLFTIEKTAAFFNFRMRSIIGTVRDRYLVRFPGIKKVSKRDLMETQLARSIINL